LRVVAYAKINLTLELLGRREDGYHEVRTILQTIDLADVLDVDHAPTLKVECDLPHLNGSGNLVWRAARELAASRGISPRARIYIRKGIPESMGLGGGSSDAAVALLALNRLWDLGLSWDELTPLAAGLGSDVPFFLRGGTALAEGRGEQTSFLPPLRRLPVLLFCPPIALRDKTRRLYSRISPAHYSDGGVTRRMLEILMGGQFVVDSVHNVFEAVAFQEFPGLDRAYRRLAEVSGSRPHLSGAGPALFCVPRGEDEGQRMANTLQAEGHRAYLVHAIMPPQAPLSNTKPR
jgi:4-diphosphocytidyl-2-C-methyl-D-erythritol kinase